MRLGSEAHTERDSEHENEGQHHVGETIARALDSVGYKPELAVRRIMLRTYQSEEATREDRQQG